MLSNAFDFQTVAAPEFWDNWKCLDAKYDVIVEFKHGDDDHRSNRCIVDIKQGNETLHLKFTPRLVQDIQDDRVSETLSGSTSLALYM